jgi:hypothetical protein
LHIISGGVKYMKRKGKSKEKRGKRISNIQQGMSNFEVKSEKISNIQQGMTNVEGKDYRFLVPCSKSRE